MKRQTLATQRLPLPHKPWLPLFLRAALGFGLAALGAGAVWFSSAPALVGQFDETRSQQLVDIDGVSQLRLKLEGDRTTLQVRPAESAGVQVEALHRKLNPLHLQQRRKGKMLSVDAGLFVDPPHSRGVLIGFEPSELKSLFVTSDWEAQLQHELTARVGGVPLNLETQTRSGPQDIDLTGLELGGLAATSGSGDLALTLPARASGSLSLTSTMGEITVAGAAQQPLPALSLSTHAGKIRADLSSAPVQQLSVAAQMGDVNVTLPASDTQANLTTKAGRQTVTVPSGSRGSLTVSNSLGEVKLRVAEGTPYSLHSLTSEQARLLQAAAGSPKLTEQAGMHYSAAALAGAERKQPRADRLSITLQLGAGAELTVEELSAAQMLQLSQGE